MMKTNTGQAVLAVERIINLVDTIKDRLPPPTENLKTNNQKMGTYGVQNSEWIEPVARDDIVFLRRKPLTETRRI